MKEQNRRMKDIPETKHNLQKYVEQGQTILLHDNIDNAQSTFLPLSVQSCLDKLYGYNK